MLLGTIHADFEAGLIDSVRVYEELATTKTFASASDFVHEDRCILEDLLSHLWQCWCRRRTLSCRGLWRCDSRSTYSMSYDAAHGQVVMWHNSHCPSRHSLATISVSVVMTSR